MISFSSCPSRSPLLEPQMAEQLMEVPAVLLWCVWCVLWFWYVIVCVVWLCGCVECCVLSVVCAPATQTVTVVTTWHSLSYALAHSPFSSFFHSRPALAWLLPGLHQLRLNRRLPAASHASEWQIPSHSNAPRTRGRSGGALLLRTPRTSTPRCTPPLSLPGALILSRPSIRPATLSPSRVTLFLFSRLSPSRPRASPLPPSWSPPVARAV